MFGRLKKHKLIHKKDIESVDDLKKYSTSNPEKFENLLKNLRNHQAEEELNVGDYRNAYDKWKKSHVDPILSQVYFFLKEKYRGIETLVLVGHEEAVRSDEWGPKFLVNRLGFRVDHVRAINAILKKYPMLFIDQASTLAFWKDLVEVPMIKNLPSAERNKIERLVDGMWSEILIKCIGMASVNIKDSKPYNDLIANISTLQQNFKYYANVLVKYIDMFNRPRDNQPCELILRQEVLFNLKIFNEACKHQDMSQASRAVQCLTELLRLSISLRPYEQDSSLSSIIKTNYFSNYSVQSVLFSTYGMRLYARVLQASSYPKNISVTNQSYFEWLIGIKCLDNKTNVRHLRYLDEVNESDQVLFMEIHPNSFTDNKQFSQSIEHLFKRLSEFKSKFQITIVVDVTLNALNDDEIKSLLGMAKSSIEDGKLNVVLIQSLTKFSQAGVDQRSGGVMVVINNPLYWADFNKKCKEMQCDSLASDLTLQYFSYFFKETELTQQYIKLVNSNVNYVYDELMNELAFLETGTKQRFHLSMSADEKGCYVALNMRGILAGIDVSFQFSKGDIEKLGKSIIERMIVPLCNFLNCPITQRMSIGFPLSSINNVFDSLRFTIGIEPMYVLNKYIDIMTFISFVLNRFRDTALLFEKDENGGYDTRHRFFSEKVSQFKAMTPGAKYFHAFTFNKTKKVNAPIGTRTVSMKNGLVNFMRYENAHMTPKIYNNGTIQLYINNELGPVPLRNINIKLRRMVMASLTELQPQDDMDMGIEFDELEQTLTLNYNIISPDFQEMLYGPFKSNSGPVYFFLSKKKIHVMNNKNIICQDNLYVQQDNMKIRFIDMPFEDRVFFFKTHYIPDRHYSEFKKSEPYRYLSMPELSSIKIQHIPLENEKMKVELNGVNVTMERDFLCAKGPGITVYKRYFNDEHTGIEIDYWQETDPVVCRFIRFVIALFANIYDMPVQKKRGFKVRKYYGDRSSNFTHFLFHLKFREVDTVFEKAIAVVFRHHASLVKLLNVQKTHECCTGQYSFFSEHVSYSTSIGTADTSAYDLTAVDGNAWIEEILQDLNSPN